MYFRFYDVTFGRNGPYGDAWTAEPLTYMYYHYRRCDTEAEFDVYECLVFIVLIYVVFCIVG